MPRYGNMKPLHVRVRITKGEDLETYLDTDKDVDPTEGGSTVFFGMPNALEAITELLCKYIPMEARGFDPRAVPSLRNSLHSSLSLTGGVARRQYSYVFEDTIYRITIDIRRPGAKLQLSPIIGDVSRAELEPNEKPEAKRELTTEEFRAKYWRKV